MAKSFLNGDEDQVISLIGKGTKIIGDITSEGDIRIDGELTGTLNCSGRVIIGVEGKISGEVTCKNFEITGYMEGKMIVEELLSIKSSSKVTGDIRIKSGKLNIEPGSLFSGSCSMDEEAPGQADETPLRSAATRPELIQVEPD
ncbi:MAG: polymer-forming cytoskeletal protein [Bacteroidales bacterium]|jgi:cytoskeletal protein CcmA (bactofilin family)|nr:polymer-forming cytoskeletal protein [Bacteroidales bacterium]